MVDGLLVRSVEDQTLFSHIGTVTGFDAERLEGERVQRIISSIAFEEELLCTPDFVVKVDELRSLYLLLR
jgi:hypothetical protein